MDDKLGKREIFTLQIIEILDGIAKRKGLGIEIQANTKIFDQKILDSMGFVEFMSILEADMGIEIPDHKLSTEFFITPLCITENFGP